MLPAFTSISPTNRLHISNRPILCPRRPRSHQSQCSLRNTVATATAAGRGGGISSTRDESLDYAETTDMDADWRKQNAMLVNVAQRNGLNAAIELLWSLTQEGIAVTQNFNQVISLLAGKGRFEDGLRLAEEAGERGLANIITFRPLMKRCCSYGDGKGAKRVWRLMTQYGIEGDMFLYAELMGALVRSQDMISAKKVVASLRSAGRRPHIILYNTLLKGYAKKADVERAFEIIKVIEETSVRPDETTFNTLLNTCVRAKDADALSQAMVLMHKHKVKPGAPTFNTLLKLYARAGKFEDALAIFEEMQQSVEPSIVTFNTLIDGCAHRGDMDQAAVFLDDMVSRGMTPDICTMTSLLKGFGRSNDPVRAIELFEAMKEGGYKIEERTRYAAINACLRGDDRKNARRIMEEMVDCGLKIRTRTWIWALERDIAAGDEKRALETVQFMSSSGSHLDVQSKTNLIRELRELGGFLRLQRELKSLKTVDNPDL